MPKLGDLLADRLIGVARELSGSFDRAAKAAESPAAPKRWLVCWADFEPQAVGLSRLLEWWPDHPEIRARLLQLQPGEAWTDPETTPAGIPLAAVIRLE